jgi:hypothetical protein
MGSFLGVMGTPRGNLERAVDNYVAGAFRNGRSESAPARNATPSPGKVNNRIAPERRRAERPWRGSAVTCGADLDDGQITQVLASGAEVRPCCALWCSGTRMLDTREAVRKRRGQRYRRWHRPGPAGGPALAIDHANQASSI